MVTTFLLAVLAGYFYNTVSVGGRLDKKLTGMTSLTGKSKWSCMSIFQLSESLSIVIREDGGDILTLTFTRDNMAKNVDKSLSITKEDLYNTTCSIKRIEKDGGTGRIIAIVIDVPQAHKVAENVKLKLDGLDSYNNIPVVLFEPTLAIDTDDFFFYQEALGSTQIL